MTAPQRARAAAAGMADPAAEVPRWVDAVVVRTVRAIEQADGALDDAQAVRLAAARAAGRDERLVARAWALAGPLGLVDDIARWRAAMPWLLAATAAVVGLFAAGIVGAVVGHDRSINAISALLAVLGLPSLSLLLWLLGLAWRRPPAGGGMSRWMLSLAARLPGLRSPHALRLLRCGLDALAAVRLLPWVLGLANHLVWIGAFVLVLGGLLWAFAFRAYTLSWETTILSPQFFATVVTATGWLPAQLGLPVPDVAGALAASTPAGDQRPWAWWLIGCTVVYGLAPRAVAALWCFAVWRRRRDRMRLIDTADPYFRTLIARFDHWDRSVVVDAERPAEAPATPHHASTVVPGTLAMIGFELPEGSDWPPPALADHHAWAMAVSGTADERRQALDRVAQTRPQRVLLVCHTPATPDRGTERFLRDALAWGADGALLLAGAPAVSTPIDAASRRWRDWLHGIGFTATPVFTDAGSALGWATGPGHG